VAPPLTPSETKGDAMADAKDKKKPKPRAPAFEYPEPLAGINRLPAHDRAVADAVCRETVAGGEQRIAQLIGLVGEFGEDKGVKPRYALHALTSYCSRAGAAEERALLAATLAKQLAGKHSPSVKAFLIRQLQLAGTPSEVPALENWIADAKLGLPAIAALIAIGDATATAALRNALPASSGRHRIGIIEGLGRLRDRASVKAIMKAAGEKDRDIRLAAIHALANIGDAGAIETVRGAVKTDSAYERTQATDCCLLLARRLAEQEKTNDAKALYQHLLAACTAPHEQHVRHAAQEGLKALSKGL